MAFRFSRFSAFAIIPVLFLSCSFNYNEGLDGEKAYPDMEMSGVSLSRYENARVTIVLSAGMLEIYDSDRVWAGSDVAFVQYAADGTGAVESEAKSGIILIDDSASVYSLGGDVEFHQVKEDIKLRAGDLQWSKKTSRLSGSKTGEVEIDDGSGTVLRGAGFYPDRQQQTGLLNPNHERPKCRRQLSE